MRKLHEGSPVRKWSLVINHWSQANRCVRCHLVLAKVGREEDQVLPGASGNDRWRKSVLAAQGMKEERPACEKFQLKGERPPFRGGEPAAGVRLRGGER